MSQVFDTRNQPMSDLWLGLCSYYIWIRIRWQEFNTSKNNHLERRKSEKEKGNGNGNDSWMNKMKNEKQSIQLQWNWMEEMKKWITLPNI